MHNFGNTQTTNAKSNIITVWANKYIYILLKTINIMCSYFKIYS